MLDGPIFGGTIRGRHRDVGGRVNVPKTSQNRLSTYARNDQHGIGSFFSPFSSQKG